MARADATRVTITRTTAVIHIVAVIYVSLVESELIISWVSVIVLTDTSYGK